MTNTRQDIIASAHRLIELYNTDVHHMIDEIYTTVDLVCPGVLKIHDRDTFHAVEQIVLDAAPDRQARIIRTIAAADHVILECAITHTDKATGERRESFWCGIFTFQDGQLVSDHSYINAAEWPGGQQIVDYLAENQPAASS